MSITHRVRPLPYALSAAIWMALAPTLAVAQAPAVRHRLVTRMTVTGAGRVGTVMQATFRVRAAIFSPQTRAWIRLESGLEIVEGQAEWSGSLQAGQEIELRATIRATRRGVFGLSVAAEDTTRVDSARVTYSDISTSYVVAGTNNGFWSPIIDQRFEAPARRALPRVLNRALGVPLVRDTAWGLQAYPLRRNRNRTERFGRALHAIDAMGADAVLEDSVTQVRRVTQALDEDVRAARAGGASLLSETPLDEPPLEEPGCQPYTVLRTGQVTFYNQNTGQYEGLPNVWVEARDAHPLVGGSLVNTFRTNADGSFSACVPYDGNFYTYISVAQDIGPLNVLRDGATVPGYFPGLYGAVWDLAGSPTLPLNTNHPEVSFALLTWYKGILEATNRFGVMRGHLTAWYYTNADTDYYCEIGAQGVPFIDCTHFGENIYFHRFDEFGGENIWTPYGQFGRLHEYGHGFEQEVLDNRLPNHQCGASHDIWSPNSLGCAVNEGWADFFAAIALPIVQIAGGAFQSMEIALFNAEAWYSFGPRGPETEGSFAAYLFDLVDGPGVPSFRYYPNDDDNVQVTFSYLMQVIRDGRVQYPYPQNAQDVIAIVDDVTPVPYKSEFASYGQPSTLENRVPPPTNLSIAQHRTIWRWNFFGLVDSSPLVVTAGVPGMVTVKSVQDLYGSASGGAGGYQGWLWEQKFDCVDCAYQFWDSNQNSVFVAYGGRYTLYWRLTASDRIGQQDQDEEQTYVCIPFSQATCTPLAPRPLIIAASAPTAAARTDGHGSAGARLAATPPPVAQPLDGHFGSGVWFSLEDAEDSAAVRFYDLAGRHDAWTPGDTWPNSFAVPLDRPRDRNVALRGRPVIVTETRGRVAPNVFFVRTWIRGGAGGSRYFLSYAIDPDLGASPADDRLIWSDSLGVVTVIDPDSGAIAYGWFMLPQGAAVSAREYSNGPGFWDPASPRAAYLEQRQRTRVLGQAGDVRFILSLGPLAASAAGDASAVVIVAKGATPEEALGSLRAARGQLALASEATPPGGAGSAPGRISVRQNLSAQATELRAGLNPSATPLVISPSVSGPRGASALTDIARIREEGITAADIMVPSQVAASRIRLVIVDSRGRPIRHAIDETLAPGTYTYRWDGLSDGGERVPPGVYQLIVEAPGHRSRTRLVITR